METQCLNQDNNSKSNQCLPYLAKKFNISFLIIQRFGVYVYLINAFLKKLLFMTIITFNKPKLPENEINQPLQFCAGHTCILLAMIYSFRDGECQSTEVLCQKSISFSWLSDSYVRRLVDHHCPPCPSYDFCDSLVTNCEIRYLGIKLEEMLQGIWPLFFFFFFPCEKVSTVLQKGFKRSNSHWIAREYLKYTFNKKHVFYV